MDPKSDLYGSCARGFGAASLFLVTFQSVSVTMALRLPGQGRLQGSQVDTAAESEPKVSSNVRGKETFLAVEFGPRREVELLSQALWYQQESQEKNVFDLHFPSAMSPHRERKGEQSQSTDQAPGRGNWGFQTKRATPGLFTSFRDTLTLHWKPEHFLFRVDIKSLCSAVAVVLCDKHKAYSKWNYMFCWFLKPWTFMEN